MLDEHLKEVITEPVYVKVREGEVDSTTEWVEGLLICDYDKGGMLLGVEILNVTSQDTD
jgi:uncharacterized protein YuzE